MGPGKAGGPPQGRHHPLRGGPAENTELEEGRICSLCLSWDITFLLLSDQDLPHRLPRFSGFCAGLNHASSFLGLQYMWRTVGLPRLHDHVRQPLQKTLLLIFLSLSVPLALFPWRTLATTTSESSADRVVIIQHGDSC